MKYPIGIQDFAKIRNEGFVYIDKTDMIYRLAKEGTIYFLSRPHLSITSKARKSYSADLP